MTSSESRVTIHMVTSLDGFIARKDGSTGWLETGDRYEEGADLTGDKIAAFLQSVDCYLMGSRTYETALDFEAKGFGWAYGDTPLFVMTRRALPKARDSVTFCTGDLAELVNGRLRPSYRDIWLVGGAALAGECLRRGPGRRNPRHRRTGADRRGHPLLRRHRQGHRAAPGQGESL